MSFDVNFSTKQCDWLIYSWESLRYLIAEFTILLVLVEEVAMNLMSFVLTISKTQHFITIFFKNSFISQRSESRVILRRMLNLWGGNAVTRSELRYDNDIERWSS